MVSVITILLFFIYIWGLGFTATYYLTKPKDFLERFFLNLGVGLGIFPILSIIINFLRIPLDWKIFLGLSVIFPIYILTKKIVENCKNKEQKWFQFPKLKLTKTTLVFILVIFIAGTSLFVYAKGSFSYPYLEDEDPWGHAVGVKYVSLEKVAYDPPLRNEQNLVDPILSYIDPYPPAYDVLMGILHQTSSNLQWTLKFFNAFIISLGFIFFYLFAKLFIGNKNKALFATFILAVIPSYLSHFIWAHSLVITLIFPMFYAFVKIKEDRRWTIVATLLVASVWVTQNLSQPLKITTMLAIFVIVGSLVYKKFLKWEATALIGGMVISFIWWGDMIMRRTLRGFLSYYEGGSESYSALSGTGPSENVFQGIFGGVSKLLKSVLNPGGSSSRAYTFNDFFVAKSQNMINAPIGIGVVISLLVLIGLLFVLIKYRKLIVNENNAWRSITLFWLIFTFWAVNGITFPVSVARGAFRAWFLLAIPVSLIATEGLYVLKAIFRFKLLKSAIVILVVIGVLFTSAQQKYVLNTAIWPTSGSFTDPQQEPVQYAQWFSSIPEGTNVFLYSPRDKLVIGLGGFSCAWCQEVIDFREKILDQDALSLHSFLKEQNYEYLIINPAMDSKYLGSKFGKDLVKEMLPKKYNEFVNSGLFTPVYQVENNFVVFKVN